MLYGTIRFILCAILFGAIFFLRKLTKRPISKRFTILLLVGLWILHTGLGYFPFENYLFAFPSPEACFSYTNQEEPDYILEGQHSAFIVTIDGSKIVCRTIGKNDGGWEIDPDGMFSTHPFNAPPSMLISMHQYNTTDCYLFICDTPAKKLTITDSNLSTFAEIELQGAVGLRYMYCANIGDISDGYTLSINGEIITLQ